MNAETIKPMKDYFYTVTSYHNGVPLYLEKLDIKTDKNGKIAPLMVWGKNQEKALRFCSTKEVCLITEFLSLRLSINVTHTVCDINP